MLELTKERIGEKAHVVQADLNQSLEPVFDKDQFDIIISALSIHYVKDWEPLFSDFARILRPSGKLIFSTHHPHITPELIDVKNYFEVELLEDEWDQIGKVKYYHHSLHDLFAALGSAGFAVEQLLEPQPLPECEQADLELYKNLKSQPRTLFIRATQ